MNTAQTEKPIHIHIAKIEGDFDTLLLLIPSIVFIIILTFYLLIISKNEKFIDAQTSNIIQVKVR